MPVTVTLIASGSGSGNSLALTTTAAVPAGATIHVVSSCNRTVGLTSVTDGAGNTYTGGDLAICDNCLALPSGSSLTVTYTYDSTNQAVCAVAYAVAGLTYPQAGSISAGTAIDADTLQSGSYSAPPADGTPTAAFVYSSYTLRATATDFFNVGGGENGYTQIGTNVQTGMFPDLFGVYDGAGVYASYREFNYTAAGSEKLGQAHFTTSGSLVTGGTLRGAYYGVAAATTGIVASVVDAARLRYWIAREVGADIVLNPYTLNSSGRWTAGTDVTLTARAEPSLARLPDNSVSLCYTAGGAVKHSRYTSGIGERYVQTVASSRSLPAHVIDPYGRLVCCCWDGSGFSVVVGTLDSDGVSYTFSAPVSLGLTSPAQKRGSLTLVPGGPTLQFVYENASGALVVVRCLQLSDAGAGTWS